MKQPKMSEIRINKKGTMAMRKKATATKKIKITINIDADVLKKVKSQAEKRGAPYQTFLNKIVRDSLKKEDANDKRLKRLEKEVRLLKKKVA